MSIPLKTGADQRLVLHVEQQHAHDQSLPRRLHQLHYRLSDKHRIPVTSLAILTGKRKDRRKPISTYTYKWYGTELLFKYNVYDVNRATEKELKNDPRIFAVVILAAKKMLAAGGKAHKRGKFALELLDLLNARGYDDERAESLQRFVSHILQIKADDIDIKVKEKWEMLGIPISEARKEIHVRVATEQGVEKGRKEGMEKGRKEGMEKGMEEKALQVARSMLDDGVSPEAIQKYTGLDMENILALR